jgi:peptide deformylase
VTGTDAGTGTARPILQYGTTPVLHRPCREVTAFDAELGALVDDMFASMYKADGVGLAANQIGVDLRVFVFDCPDADGRNQVGHLVNPSLVPIEGRRELDDDSEGCLSVLGQHADLARPATATVTGVDRDGRPVTYQGTGMLARCFQHEVDHLDGIVYVDRLSKRTRKKVLKAAGLPTEPVR